MPKKIFILYDYRAQSGDTSEAAILACTPRESFTAEESKPFRNLGAMWYQFEQFLFCKGTVTVSKETMRPDLGKFLIGGV